MKPKYMMGSSTSKIPNLKQKATILRPIHYVPPKVDYLSIDESNSTPPPEWSNNTINMYQTFSQVHYIQEPKVESNL